MYAKVVNKGSTLRLAFAAAVFGESMEALFWLQLPHALRHLLNKLANKSPIRGSHATQTEIDEASMLNRISSKGKSVTGKKDALVSRTVKTLLSCQTISICCFLKKKLAIRYYSPYEKFMISQI